VSKSVSAELEPAAEAAPRPPKRPPKDRTKPSRDPISWTRDRHPWSASKEEVGILTGRGLSFVNQKIKAGVYSTVREGRRLDILLDSVFDDRDRILEQSSKQPKPKGGPGRPKKPKEEEAGRSKGRGKKAAQA
jgi:hypothetical protein